MSLSSIAPTYEVELPGGGKLQLQSPEEVELWETSRDRYLSDFRINQQSDRLLVGAVLTQHLALFRAQQRLNGMEAQLDNNGIPTGRYRKVKASVQDMAAAQNIIIKAASEIRELEKALGIDKKTRDQGGQYDVATYVSNLKAASRSYGAHVSRRYKAYEEFVMELRVQLRMLQNLDDEDLVAMNISPEKVCDWARGQLAHLEELDQKYAREKGKAFVGRVR